MLQLVLGKLAKGVPKVLVSAVEAPFLTAAGTEPEFRGQNQTLIAVEDLSIAYHPPPLALNEGP